MTNDSIPEELMAIRAAVKQWTDADWDTFKYGRFIIHPLAKWVGLLQEAGWKPGMTLEQAGRLVFGDR